MTNIRYEACAIVNVNQKSIRNYVAVAQNLNDLTKQHRIEVTSNAVLFRNSHFTLRVLYNHAINQPSLHLEQSKIHLKTHRTSPYPTPQPSKL